jgi:hypothetical protein
MQMPVITRSELEIFINAYLKKFSELTFGLSKEQKDLLLPRYLIEKCEIIATVSRSKGVSIRFNITKNRESFEFQNTEKSIEDEVLPSLSGKGCFFRVSDGKSQSFYNRNLITQEFYDKHKDFIDTLARGSNFFLKEEKIAEIASGDLELVDCALAFCKNGKDVLDKFDCLWLFSSNQSQDFSREKAELLATMKYSRLTSILVPQPIQNLTSNLTEYKKLIGDEKTTEPKMQTFFKNNWLLLKIAAIRALSKPILDHDQIPDFVIEMPNSRCIIVEIKSPKAKLCTRGKRPIPSYSLRKAQSQIESYLDYVQDYKNNVRRNLPDSVKLEETKGLIVIGKMSTLSDDQKKTLDKERHGKNYEIVTYDELFLEVNSLLENIKKYRTYESE